MIHLSNLPLNCQFQAKLQEEGKFIVTLRENVKKRRGSQFSFIGKHKCWEDDLDFSGFINFCGVDRDGYPMLADVATAVTNGLCSSQIIPRLLIGY